MFKWLGIGRGKIEVQLNKYQFAPGETIEGKMALKLKKPVETNGIDVKLIGERRERTYSGSSRGSTSRTTRIFDFKLPVAGPGGISPGQQLEYPFKIKIPKDVGNQVAPDGALGSLVKAAKFMSGSSTRVSWFLEAHVDVPKAIDMRKKVQINIT